MPFDLLLISLQNRDLRNLTQILNKAGVRSLPQLVQLLVDTGRDLGYFYEIANITYNKTITPMPPFIESHVVLASLSFSTDEFMRFWMNEQVGGLKPSQVN
jgi:hypothetical protein